jgi:hypothetical protein
VKAFLTENPAIADDIEKQIRLKYFADEILPEKAVEEKVEKEAKPSKTPKK